MPTRPSWTAGEPGRFVAASAAGAGLALFLFTLVLTRGRADLVQWQRSGGFYDAQAHAWLAGNWEIPDHVLTIEKFLHDGRAYMYQGPWPALLRLPIVAVTSRFDGRLTQLSMVLATLVAMVGTAHLHWQVRRLLRPDSPVRRPDLLVAALATFVVGGGSALLYEASRAWVYHEAALWGAAWTIVAISVVLSCTQRPSRGRFAWAALVTTLAACSRLLGGRRRPWPRWASSPAATCSLGGSAGGARRAAGSDDSDGPRVPREQMGPFRSWLPGSPRSSRWRCTRPSTTSSSARSSRSPSGRRASPSRTSSAASSWR